MESKMLKKLLDIKEVSELIGISPSTIYKMTHKKRIPFVKVGRLVKFEPAKIIEWLERNSFSVKEN